MVKLEIAGYLQDGYCEHCGRPLKHCIRLTDGREVGAHCFANVITKPKIYMGKPYRLPAEKIITMAKIREYGLEYKYGYRSYNFIFEQSENDDK